MRTVLIRRAQGALVVTTMLALSAACSSDTSPIAEATSGGQATERADGGADNGDAKLATLPTAILQSPIAVAVLAPRPDPVSAINTFVQAEVEDDAATAWSMLSAPDRRRHSSPELWRTEHRQLPDFAGVTITGEAVPASSEVTGEGVDIRADVRFEATLDQTKGLIPAGADATWRVVREDGGWRVSYAESTFVARYPSDAGVLAAATAWATARQQCRTTAANGNPLEVVGGVVGIAGLANRLCGATGPVTVGAMERIPTTDAAAIIAAFGTESVEWARTVAIKSPVAQRVILGPLGDRWIAIGVLAT